MKTILPLLLFFFICTNILSAQQSSSLCIIINPSDASIKIDGNVYHLKGKSLPYCIDITVGNHLIEIWSPYFEPHVDTVQVFDRKVNRYIKSLNTVSSEYAIYLDQKNAYNTRKGKRIVNFSLLGVANIGLLAIIASPRGIRKLEKLEEETNTAKLEYDTNLSLDNIFLAEKRYDNRLKEYNKQRRQLIFSKSIAIPVLIGSVYVTWRYFKKVRKNKLTKPTFEPPKSPYTFQFNIDPVYRTAGINMSLSF